MRGLFPRPLFPPIPCNPGLISGSSCSSVCGDLCCFSRPPVLLFKKIPGQVRLLWGFSAGSCVPLGSGDIGPISTRVSSTASSPGGPSCLHLLYPGGSPSPHHVSPLL